ncbi:MAG: iron-sulfur cluster-binding domain-containing protein [Candidatus Lindowbacteria bacterium]|nr:iron-sulfur cluster-binding domain-containing protein [Candidatus Lindowbacteria bacterium]
MKVNVKGHIRDLLAFRALAPKRKKRIAKSPAKSLAQDPMNNLARRLHPESQRLVIAEIKDEAITAKTFRLVADPESDTKELAYFRAGQYLSLKVEVGGVRISRPYSISSAPFEALGPNGFYEITVRKQKGGFLTSHMWDNWKVGSKIRTSGPCGLFYYEPLRDAGKVTGLAGGSGITPFRSLAREIAQGELDAQLLLIYGSSDENDVLFYDELKELEKKAPDKFRVVHVLSCKEVQMEGCELGLITAETIKKHADMDNSSFFVCGPQAMYKFVEGELQTLNLPHKRIRREVFGEVKDITQASGFPLKVADETFRLKVHIGGATTEIPARAAESVLVAMERANLAPPSECRSGECGFCRSLLIGGDVFLSPEIDGRRAADKLFGYIHPCSSYPVTDIEVAVARGA